MCSIAALGLGADLVGPDGIMNFSPVFDPTQDTPGLDSLANFHVLAPAEALLSVVVSSITILVTVIM